LCNQNRTIIHYYESIGGRYLKDKELFWGHHSEWNLGSPGGWDYQRMTQEIGKAVFEQLFKTIHLDIQLDFDHPMLFPVYGFVNLLKEAYKKIDKGQKGLIAVVAEEETLEDVVENKNLMHHLNAIDGINSILIAPHQLEILKGHVSFQGQPVSLIFMDFNTDVLLKLHRKHNLTPLLQAVSENRVINPRGTEPINVKSMFELITHPESSHHFHAETVKRTPWTRQFYSRSTEGPKGETIPDLIEWTRRNWENLVLKPERGYSGMGVRVGGVHPNADESIQLALSDQHGAYIVQEKIPLPLWAEIIPQYDEQKQLIQPVCYQTDFRCLFSGNGLMGFLGRYGNVPTNVGSGGGVQPLAVLRSQMSIYDATARLNEAILSMPVDHICEAITHQKNMAIDRHFTYLLGPIKIALRPRLITEKQMAALADYCSYIWKDCLTLEKMFLAGQLDHIIKIEPEELNIARSQPWGGSSAILASDGIFSFGAHEAGHEY